ncbi:Mrp/NBP35 family ATP-binding protein [Desulforamulus hydrothermalis]|uniref:Iron-sulfur cluster carrier protein n=1 Tax=Desulforamulus hydrothermalis Lam5 = DSM 18033 TaxID=1121428 RepID=K8DXW6_9FIRM|nr:Mrp/NBP35 family ATP-binding protein [Desulforamulus hydrothermalis]CCO07455.1 Protein mrp homolog [Desulforamulus hydrothermalis Lam5 = DSM 18033]SHH18119.1 Chromosome partitioning ATPase, Mrp family, contains Fe-S cluster [Desulforamulus hydrothermalis Lam5 = DSM 18033]
MSKDNGQCASCEEMKEGTCGGEKCSPPPKLYPGGQSKIGRVIAVMSGKGGVGKSSVTSLMAVNLQRMGYKVGILDADITGPSIPKMFGVKRVPASRGLLLPAQSRTGISIMSLNLLLEKEDEPVIWRGPILAGAVKQFWTDVNWGELDYLLLDMPPGTGDIPLTVLQQIPVDGIVVVTSPQDLAVMVVKKAVKMAGIMEAPILGFVQNMAYATCPKCGEKFEIYGKPLQKGDSLEGLPVLEVLPIDPAFTRLCDNGLIEDTDTAAFKDIPELLKNQNQVRAN